MNRGQNQGSENGAERVKLETLICMDKHFEKAANDNFYAKTETGHSRDKKYTQQTVGHV